MPNVYDVKTTLVNEGTSSIERKMIKVSQLSGMNGEEFIKTFPFLQEFKTRRMLHLIEHELPPAKKRSFLGIGFNAYEYINYMRFYSTYKSFPLAKGDSIELTFENGEKYLCEFESQNKNMGFMYSNICPVSDQMLRYLAENKIESWQLVNKQKDYAMVGGFIPEENNKQYFSQRVGQELFRKMAAQVIESKKQWFGNIYS